MAARRLEHSDVTPSANPVSGAMSAPTLLHVTFWRKIISQLRLQMFEQAVKIHRNRNPENTPADYIIMSTETVPIKNEKKTTTTTT